MKRELFFSVRRRSLELAFVAISEEEAAQPNGYGLVSLSASGAFTMCSLAERTFADAAAAVWL